MNTPVSKIERRNTPNNKKTNSSRIISNIGIGHRNEMINEAPLSPVDNAESREPDNSSDDISPEPNPAHYGGLEPPPMPPGMTFNE